MTVVLSGGNYPVHSGGRVVIKTGTGSTSGSLYMSSDIGSE